MVNYFNNNYSFIKNYLNTELYYTSDDNIFSDNYLS